MQEQTEQVPQSFNKGNIETANRTKEPFMALGNRICIEALALLKESGVAVIRHPAVQTTLALLELPPQSIFDHPSVIIRTLEYKHMMWLLENLTGTNIHPRSILSSGSGNIFNEAWAIADYALDQARLPDLIKTLEIIETLGFGPYMAYTQKMSAPLAIEAALSGSVLTTGMGAIIIPDTESYYYHFAEPHLDTFFLSDDLTAQRETLLGTIPFYLARTFLYSKGSITDIGQPSSGLVVTQDTHASLSEYYPPGYFDQVCLFRFDPISFLPIGESIGTRETYVHIINNMNKLFNATTVGGTILFSTGIGNNGTECYQRALVMYMWEDIFNRIGVAYTRQSELDPTKQVYWIYSRSKKSPLADKPAWIAHSSKSSGQWHVDIEAAYAGYASHMMLHVIFDPVKFQQIPKILTDQQTLDEIFRSSRDQAHRYDSRIHKSPSARRPPSQKRKKKQKRKKRRKK
jgi:hypothetical protein